MRRVAPVACATCNADVCEHVEARLRELEAALSRQQAVIEAARSKARIDERRFAPGDCGCQICEAIRALDAKEQP